MLEPLLRAHVVVGIEAGELLDEELVRHVVTDGSDVTLGRWRRAELHEGLAGDAGQHGRVTMLGGQVFGHGPLF